MLTPKQEAERLYRLSNEDCLRSIQIIESQLNVVYTRAQVLVGISGMVITVTGFSGRTIAETSQLAQYLIIIGLGVVLAATVWVFLKVMRLKWATANIQDDPIESIALIISYRNQKTVAYEMGGRILTWGLICYGIAVSLMLVDVNF